MKLSGKLFRAVSLFFVLAVVVSPALAQSGQIVQIHALDDSDFPTLTVAASVLDANGRPVTGLTADDFEVLEDGVPGTLLDVQPVVDTDVGIAVVIAIDTSSSMTGSPLAITKGAASAFVDGLGDADQVAVLSFAETVEVRQEFTADKEAAKAAINGLIPAGRTVLYDGAYHAVQLASDSGLARRMVVLLSDANEFGQLSLAARSDAFVAAREEAIPVYTIALGSSVDEVYMRELATLTGGEAYLAPTLDELGTLYARLAELLRNQYVLSVQSSVLGDGQPHALTVRLRESGAEASRTFVSRAFSPGITLNGLHADQILAKPVTLTPAIASQGVLAEVTYALDGQTISSDPQPPYSVFVNPHGLAAGAHILTVKARDAAGNTGQTRIPFEVPSLPPMVSLPTLSSAETLAEALVLEPDIASQGPVQQVTYTIDGSPVYTATESPYRYTLNPADLHRGEHTLGVVVTDQSGQQGGSDFAFSVGRKPVNLLTVGLGVGVLALGTVLVLLLAGAVLMMRRRPEIVAPTGQPVLAPALEGEPDAWLRVDSGGDQRGQTFPLTRQRVVIGRSPRCDWVLDDVQRFVSREHAAVWWQDARYTIEDLKSSRGTYVNGRRLEGRHRLSNGDEIRLGNFIVIFQELVFDEDMELTQIEPASTLVPDDTRELTKTDSLEERRRKARRFGGSDRS